VKPRSLIQITDISDEPLSLISNWERIKFYKPKGSRFSKFGNLNQCHYFRAKLIRNKSIILSLNSFETSKWLPVPHSC
jgi:hypothetical protein